VGTWVQALRLLDGVAASLAVFDAAIFDSPLDELTAALSPAARGLFGRLWARIGNGDYRRARATALSLWRAAKPRPTALHAAVAAAASQATAWRQAAVDGGGPRLPADLTGAEGAFGQLSAELQALAGWMGTADLSQLSIPQLTAHLQALIADTQSLFKLPELARFRTALHSAGMWPLIEEIAHRNLTIDQALDCAAQVWLSSILDNVSAADPRVGAFDGQAHLRTVAQFRAADKTHIDTAAVRVRRAVAENATRARDAYPRESEVIEHQARLKRGHLPVRQLFQACGCRKPCHPGLSWDSCVRTGSWGIGSGSTPDQLGRRAVQMPNETLRGARSLPGL